MGTQTTPRRTVRGFVLFGILSFVGWQVAVLLDAPHRSVVAIALFGFVFHVIFGKAYTLVPSYFERQLSSPWGPQVHLPLTAIAAVLLAVEPVIDSTFPLQRIGAILWTVGVVIFLGTLLLTLRGNLTGAATGTGGTNRHRRQIDRIANAFVPVVLLYFAVGTYEFLAISTSLPPVFDGAMPRASHLFGAGTAALLVFAIGARLLPRFFVAEASRVLVAVMLTCGAIAPVLIAAGLGSTTLLHVAGTVMWLAVASYLVLVATLTWRSSRRRVGLVTVLVGSIGGLAGVSVGMAMAIGGVEATLLAIHVRLVLLGFLGLTIVGILIQFYPPSISTWPGIDDRWAAIAVAVIVAGLVFEVGGRMVDWMFPVVVGQGLVAGASVLVAWNLFGLTVERGLAS